MTPEELCAPDCPQGIGSFDLDCYRKVKELSVILMGAIAAPLGAYSFVVAMQRAMLTERIGWPLRVLARAGAVLSIFPGWRFSVIALALVTPVVLTQLRAMRTAVG